MVKLGEGEGFNFNLKRMVLNMFVVAISVIYISTEKIILYLHVVQ